MTEIITLENGVRVALDSIPSVRSIAIGIFVKQGSRNEDASNNGICHFIEHMLFKGTEKRTAKDIACELDAVGGQLNAYTTKEFTCYYARVLDTHFDTALDVLSDMFYNSRFDDSDIKREMGVIQEEISMYEDAPEDLIHDLHQSSVWPEDSLGYPILGTAETITSFNSERMKNYFLNNYTADRIVVAVAGNFEHEPIKEKIRNIFTRSKNAAINRSFSTIYHPGVSCKEKDIEQIHLMASFPSFGSGTDESYTMSALNTIFGGGMSSRLFQNIREDKGLVYTIYSYNTSYKDAGLFTIYAALSPSNVAEALRLVKHEISALSSDPITPLQLHNAKEQIKSNYVMGQESVSNRMSGIGRSILLLNRTLTQDEMIKKIDDVTLDRVNAMIASVFDISKISLSIVGKWAETPEKYYDILKG